MARAARRVCVVGLGYVGLPTAATLAARGMEVIGVDVDADRVVAINSGTLRTVEPDLDALVRGTVAAGNLRAQTEPCSADVFIIAVPTPFGTDHVPDLSYLRSAAGSVASVLEPDGLVLLESTSPVGTTEKLSAWLAERRADLSFPHTSGERSEVRLAYSPERSIPGRMLTELVHNDRVIGGITPACASAAVNLYRVFVRGACHLTTAATAELTKLAENAYRDVNIAFANEISLVCGRLGIDPWELITLANHHPRVDILRPGPGVGGHCIAVDPWFIVSSSPERTPLIQTARRVNDGKPLWVAEQVIAACKRVKNPVIACLGLAYKANVGDMRESPAITVVKRLQMADVGTLLVVEPHIDELPIELSTGGRTNLVSLETALISATVVLLLTDHQEFSNVDPHLLSGKRIINTRGNLDAI